MERKSNRQSIKIQVDNIVEMAGSELFWGREEGAKALWGLVADIVDWSEVEQVAEQKRWFAKDMGII